MGEDDRWHDVFYTCWTARSIAADCRTLGDLPHRDTLPSPPELT
jgi:hypothetical protein